MRDDPSEGKSSSARFYYFILRLHDAILLPSGGFSRFDRGVTADTRHWKSSMEREMSIVSMKLAME